MFGKQQLALEARGLVFLFGGENLRLYNWHICRGSTSTRSVETEKGHGERRCADRIGLA